MRYSEKARYLDLFNRMLDFVFLLDSTNYQILDANPAAEMALDTPLSAMKGKEISDWMTEPAKTDFERFLRIAKRSYYPKRFTSTWKIHEGGISHFEIVVCTLQLGDDGASTVLQLIARDITKEIEARQELDRYVKKLEEISTHDELTGLANLRYFKSELKTEHYRAQRNQGAYCLVMCDADNFKHYNDRNGHPAGDALLKELARILTGTARITDLAARYGGEEFVVLCRATPLEGGRVFAERLRKKIEEYPFPHGNAQPLGKVTISIGVAAFPHNADSEDAIIKAADVALYQSKASGRNRVTVSDAAPELKPDTP
jgi:diguanylate cyclase (GGDEF)-like protein/PAS domain S-box-containing protein